MWQKSMHLWVNTLNAAFSAAFSMAPVDAIVGNLLGFNVAKVDALIGRCIER